jgi:hypothetical protein
VNLALCLIGIFAANRRIQLALLAVSLLYHVFLIAALYSTQQATVIRPEPEASTLEVSSIPRPR